MISLLKKIWNRGVVSTFLAGLFVILPIIITIAIVGWVVDLLRNWLGGESIPGRILQFLGLKLVSNDTIAFIVGWAIVLVGIWMLGLFIKSFARYKTEEVVHSTLNKVPLLKSIYGPVSQVVGMLRMGDKQEMKGMQVVYCEFGKEHGGGLLALQASTESFRFRGKDCFVIYVPTSPVPMSGAIVFVPQDSVTRIDMEIDALMQIYFSLGVMSEKVVPEAYRVPITGTGKVDDSEST